MCYIKKITLITQLVLLIFYTLSNNITAITQPAFLQQDQQHVKKQLARMTLEQKIGQLFIASAVSDVEQNKSFIEKKEYPLDPAYIKELITNYHIGGVIFLGRGDPETQVKVTLEFQALSELPLLICQDLEWGLSMRLDDTICFPKNGYLGKLNNNNLIYQLGHEIGKQCKEIGVDLNFAPVVDVNNNPNNPVIGARSFGDNKENVTQKAGAFCAGLHDAGIISCIKHFPGHGDTDVDSHYALPYIVHSTQRLHEIELYPFKKSINAGTPAVMIAHLAVPALEPNPDKPTTLSHAVVTTLLQEQLGFNGLVITDALDMKALSGNAQEIALQAFLAGNDLLLCSTNIPAAIAEIKQAVYDNIVSEDEIDHRVKKVLLAKEWAHKNAHKELSVKNLYQRLHTHEAEQLQQKLFNN